MDELSATPQPRLTIVYDEVEELPGGKGMGSVVRRVVTKVGELDTEELARNLRAFCSTMGAVFAGVSTAIRDYELERVEVQVEVTGKGEIRFIGGAATEISGGVTLVFARAKKPVAAP